MVFKSIIGAVSVCLATVSINASALPINIIDNGGYMTDTAEGLDWLDLSYTSGVSYNDALLASTSVEGGGWSYATNAQVEVLLATMFDGIVYNLNGYAYVVGSTQASAFGSVFGSSETTANTVGTRSYGLYADETDTLRLAGSYDYNDVSFRDLINGADYFYDYEARRLSGNAVISTYLVRGTSSVPEPSIAILMASGLIVFGVVRRKSRI